MGGLVRRRDDRVLGGVASGLGAHFGIDPMLVRIAFVFVAFFGGGGFLLYLVLWLIVPEEQTGDVVARRDVAWADEARRLRSERGWPFWVGLALIALAAVTVVDHLFFIRPGILWALVFMGLGVALFQASRPVAAPGAMAEAPRWPGGGPSRPVPSDADASATPFEAAPHDDVTDVVEDVVPPAPDQAAGIVPPQWPYGNPASDMAPRPPRAPRPRRERSILGRLTLGVAVLWVGIAALVDQASTSVDFTSAGLVGVAMAIVGVGLLVGGFAGRARWLVLVGILLTPVLVAASFADRVDVPFGAGMGQRWIGLTDREPTADQELFAGELFIDVAEDGLDGTDRTVRARVGAGQIQVAVPAHWTMVVRAEVDAGEVVIEGPRGGRAATDQGTGARVEQVFPGVAGAPTVALDLEVVFGQVEIVRYGTANTNFDELEESF